MSGEVVHRLGMAVCALAGLWWLARSLDTARRRRRLRARLAAVLALAAEPPRRSIVSRGVVRRWLPVAGAVCAAWVLVGGLPGLLLGPAAGVGAWLWLRRARRAGGDPAEAYDAAEAARRLPLAADLLAACITAGASPVVAAQAVGEALGGPVGERLSRGRQRHGSGANRPRRGVGWLPSPAPGLWRGFWNAPTSPAYLLPPLSPGSPPRPAPSGAVRRRSGPAGPP